MKTLLHLTTNDFKRFRALVVVMVLLSIVKILVNYLLDPSGIQKYYGYFPLFLGYFNSLIWAGGALLSLVTIPVICQCDSVQGSTSFWMTRPIQWKHLLGAKLLLLLGVLVVPEMLVQTCLMSQHHVMIDHIILGNCEILYRGLVMIVFLMALASVTKSFTSYAISLIGGVTSLALTKFLYSSGENFFHDHGQISVSLEHSRFIIQSVILVVAALIVLSIKYRRGTRPMVGVLIGFGGLLIATWVDWSWDRDFLKAPDAHAREVQEKTFIIALDSKMEKELTPGLESSLSYVNGRFSIKCLEPDIFGEIPRVDLKWVVKGQVISHYSGEFDGGLSMMTSPELHLNELKQALHVERMLSPAPESKLKTRLLYVSAEDRNSLDSVGLLSGTVDLVAYGYEPWADLPLRPGAHVRSGLRYLSLSTVNNDAVGETPSECHLSISESTLDLLSVPTDELSYRFPYSLCPPSYFFLLVNRQKSEAILPAYRSDVILDNVFKAPSVLSSQNIELNFTNPGGDWLQQAVLVRVERKRVGELHPHFEFSNFNPSLAQEHVFDDHE